MQCSIVVPVYCEAESLRSLHQQITQTIESHSLSAEIIFVDDGSHDASWEIIRALAAESPITLGIRLRRNFGKAAALSAGFRASRGETILMMDADLQDDPAEIINFLNKINEGFDVVNGWKVRRLDPWHKTYPSWVFNALVSRLTGVALHDHNCGLKAFQRSVVLEIRIYGELHRFIPVLAKGRGFRVTELAVNHRARQFGHSKYGLARFTRGFLDLLTVAFLVTYRSRPLHLLGSVGLLLLVIGLSGLGFLASMWIAMNALHLIPVQPIGTRPLLAYFIAATLLGGQVLSLGLLAELIVHNTRRESDSYSVSDRT